MSRIVHSLTLFSSLSTLICCALPALLVAIGAGAALSGLVSEVPQLIWLSEHKVPLFIFAGCMLSLSAFLRYNSRNAPCPSDPNKAAACASMRKGSFYVFVTSLVIYITGLFFAFIAPNL